MTYRWGSAWMASAGLLLAGAGVFVLARAAGDAPATAPAAPPATEPATEPATQPPNIYQALQARGNFKTLVKALDAAGLAEGIQRPGPFTLLAPTDEAFAKLPPGKLESLLKPDNRRQLAGRLVCHVLPGKVTSATFDRLRLADTFHGTTLLFRKVGGKTRVDDADVTAVDIPASNGVIHVIDRVLAPKTVAGVAEASGQFTKLLAAAKETGMIDLLDAPGQTLTLFAPTDEAFAVQPPGTVEELLKPPNRARLAELIKHHLVRGRVFLEAGKLTPLAGPPLNVVDDQGVFLVNGANVLLENIKATNGMVHVVDRLLIPAAGGDGKKAASAP